MNSEGFKRKLAAILSADVVGYSRLMGEDEQATIQTLTSHRELMTSLIKREYGRVIDSPGDNLLAEFESAVHAVECAVKIQKELFKRNAELSENRRMEYRIGVNLGEVIEEGDRIYGDGVNIAARLESLAEPGGICISAFVHSQVKSRLQLEYEYLGEKTVKNIKEPVAVYRVVAFLKEMALEPSAIERAAPTKPSIAVLPFVNMSNDPEQEYFSDGMTEELISALAKLKGLKVISRTSAFCFKGKDADLRTIGNKLNVNNVLEGSVRKAGNRLRITAQLINVADDTHLWSETFDRELKDVFAIQEEISQAIVKKFEVSLLDKGDRELVSRSTEDQQSHDLYLKALFSWNKREPKKAIDYLEQSIALDPNNALAYARLSIYYTHIAFFFPYSPKLSYDKAKVAATKALEIDNMLADAHVAIGVVKMTYEYDWAGAEEAFSRAIKLNPGLWTAHHYYGWYQFCVGHSGEAIAALKRAFELDPLSIPINSFLGLGFIMAHQYDQAIDILHRFLEMVPNDPSSMANLGLAYAKKGIYEEAIATLKRGANLFPENPFLLSALGYAYGVAGMKGEAQKIVNRFIKISKEKYFSPVFISRVYAGMGDVDQAIAWLEKAYEERDPAVCIVKSVPSHDYMHSEPRFQELLKKMGLEE
jgi:adenylate cyclase